MSIREIWPWIALVMLGLYHGLNPAMGWLFAVALGLQERRRAAVVRAFAPIGLGHAISIAAVAGLMVIAQAAISLDALRALGAIALIAFGLYKLLAPLSHPRWVGMRVNFRDLTLWSFLMATAHGAGLMLIPVLMNLPSTATPLGQDWGASHIAHASGAHAEHLLVMGSMAAVPAAELAAIAVHSLAMFFAMASIALVVYEKLGLAILRRAWLNLDGVWAAGLIGAGVLSLILAYFGAVGG